MESKIIKSDFNGLNNLVKALSDTRVVQVGVMGKKAMRKGKDATATNAELGAIHEFGSQTKGIPARSWLRMPLHQQTEQIIGDTAAGSMELAKAGNKIGILKVLGIACENAIQRAFGSHGFGGWAPDKPATIKQKKSSAPLIDTGQLRRSVSSRVVNAS